MNGKGLVLNQSEGDMNMNVKGDNDDEQSVHFPNRATIALQSTPAAYINLNLVNPNLSNSSYILNPVTSVPQNLVAYQSPVALQSYITLQETDGSLVNNLQVGVPVPIGLPVPAELLQNPNLVNTSIIIGNEDCNQPVIFKPAPNDSPMGNDKISYVPKPIIQEVKPLPMPDEQNMRLNDIAGISIENVLKKPCPLEMSIKAANIDLEFEKCEPDDSMPESNGLLQNENYPIIQKLPIQDQLGDNIVFNIPDKALLEVPVVRTEPEEVKRPKTEITWENNSVQVQATSNEFQESLICEVEEVNEDDEGRDDGNGENSSDDNETLPLSSVVLKLRRVQDENERVPKNAKKKFKEQSDGVLLSNKKFKTDSTENQMDPKKFLKVRHCCSRKECFKKISLKDQKIAHKNFYDLESPAKQDTYLINCIEHVQTSRSFSSDGLKEMNDKKDKLGESEDANLLEAANMQLEIENESNGNQMLSDEIQKAIKESLKDCMANQTINREKDNGEFSKRLSEGEARTSSDEEEDEKIQNWNYYIVIDRCRKKVCLQFLLKLFRITKNRIKKLQEKILSGQPISDDSSPQGNNDETFDVWDFARIHLNTLSCEEHPCCRSNRRHRFASNETTVEYLFDVFKDFYRERAGKELKIKLPAYKRFLRNDAHFSVDQMKRDSCSECDLLEDGKKNKKGVNESAVTNNIAKLDRSFQGRKKGRRKWEISSDSECSSDDEPLAKRKRLKLTISLKGNKLQNFKVRNLEKNDLNDKRKCKKNAKTKKNGVRGRDVWSLMLLHLETMPYVICKNCVSRKRHKFFVGSLTKQALYEDYRRYFLKETNSELGLGFSMYEKYFDRNCGYTIGDVDVNIPVCPRCALEPPKVENKSNKKSSKNYNNNNRLARHDDSIS